MTKVNLIVEPSESLRAASFVSPLVLRFPPKHTHPFRRLFSPAQAWDSFATVPSNDNERTKVQASKFQNGVCHEGVRRSCSSLSSPIRGKARLNGKSKEYRFEMRRWVLTYPYPHPRPSDDLLGASYPNLDIRSTDKQPLQPTRRNPRQPLLRALPSTPIPWWERVRANPRRQERSTEATLAKTNPGSTLRPSF